jgi:hypothetical protein
VRLRAEHARDADGRRHQQQLRLFGADRAAAGARRLAVVDGRRGERADADAASGRSWRGNDHHDADAHADADAERSDGSGRAAGSGHDPGDDAGHDPWDRSHELADVAWNAADGAADGSDRAVAADRSDRAGHAQPGRDAAAEPGTRRLPLTDVRPLKARS